MRISSVQTLPLHAIAYQTAGPSGHSVSAILPIYLAAVDVLGPALRAIICTSDLQGMEPCWPGSRAPRLLGELVAEELFTLAQLGELPLPEETGAILAGDLYSAPAADERGAGGDVLPVWRAFRAAFRWVAGVPGNHDSFGRSEGDLAAFLLTEGVHLMDGSGCEIDGLRLAGLGGVIGNPQKPRRRAEAQFTAAVGNLSANRPDLLVLHEGPSVEELEYLGSSAVRRALEASFARFVVSGHSSWPYPLAELSNGCQVLNVDSRVIILMSGFGG